MAKRNAAGQVHIAVPHIVLESSEIEFTDIFQAESTPALDPKPINTTALIGLRGILAVYVMVYHSFLLSTLRINILGTIPVTFFILISGFVLALNHGKRMYYPTKCCTELTGDPADKSRFDAKHFYQRRAARTLPLFYLLNLTSIPLIFGGHSHLGDEWAILSLELPLTVFAANSWLGIPLTLNGPAWFVATIWFFYWIFPSLLPRLQGYNTEEKQKWIIGHCVFQLFIPMVMFGGGIVVDHTYSVVYGFWSAHTWPVSRLPQFVMGMLAGLLRNEGRGMRSGHRRWSVEQWGVYVDTVATLSVPVLVILCVIASRDAETQNVMSLYSQFLITWWALEFIVSLTLDEGTSVVSKVLRSNMALFLGRISYALFLVQLPILQYLCWIIHGQTTGGSPQCGDGDISDCEREIMMVAVKEEWLIPVWCIPVMWTASGIMAIVLTRFVEEPLRKRLRPRHRGIKKGTFFSERSADVDADTELEAAAARATTFMD